MIEAATTPKTYLKFCLRTNISVSATASIKYEIFEIFTLAFITEKAGLAF
jgi:hypothetical protein